MPRASASPSPSSPAGAAAPPVDLATVRVVHEFLSRLTCDGDRLRDALAHLDEEHQGIAPLGSGFATWRALFEAVRGDMRVAGDVLEALCGREADDTPTVIPLSVSGHDDTSDPTTETEGQPPIADGNADTPRGRFAPLAKTSW